jgi:hypothetical protein
MRRRRRPSVSGFPVLSARAQRPGSFFYGYGLAQRYIRHPGEGRDLAGSVATGREGETPAFAGVTMQIV